MLRDALRARLRFDYLFWPSLTLSRADVLDGAVLMHTSPREIKQWLAIPDAEQLPIRVMTRTGSLATDLMDWIRTDPPAEPAVQTMFFAVAPAVNEVLSRELVLPPGRSWRDAIAGIRNVVGDDPADELQRYWSTWFAEEGLVSKVRFAAPADYEAYLKTVTADDLREQHGLGRDQEQLVAEALTLYGLGLRTFRESNWSRSVLTRWLETRAADSEPQALALAAHRLTVGLCRARAASNGTSHETVAEIQFSESWLLEAAHRLLTDASEHADYRAMERLAIPPDVGAWLVDCDFESTLRQIKSERAAFLSENSTDSFKRLADKLADVILRSPGPVPASPSREVVRLLRVVAAGTGVLQAVEMLHHGQLVWPQLPIAVGGSAVAAAVAAHTVGSRVVTGIQQKRLRRQLVYRCPQG